MRHIHVIICVMAASLVPAGVVFGDGYRKKTWTTCAHWGICEEDYHG